MRGRKAYGMREALFLARILACDERMCYVPLGYRAQYPDGSEGVGFAFLDALPREEVEGRPVEEVAELLMKRRVVPRALLEAVKCYREPDMTLVCHFLPDIESVEYLAYKGYTLPFLKESRR